MDRRSLLVAVPVVRLTKVFRQAAQSRITTIPHDFRWTAVHGLLRAGVPECVTEQLTEHTTRAVFERHNIMSPGPTRRGTAARPVGLEFVVRRRLGAGRGPCNGRPSAHGSGRQGPPCVHWRRPAAYGCAYQKVTLRGDQQISPGDLNGDPVVASADGW
jgi:hypothetical protein